MKVFFVFTVFSFFFFTTTAQVKTTEVCYNPNLVVDTTKKSIKSMAIGTVDGDSIIIRYHSPGVRKRIIWGGLVPFEEVWVTGAHDATSIEFQKTLLINGKEIQPGKYAFFTIPGKKEWTLILNRRWQQHLATEYNAEEDVLRWKIKPVKNKHTERLQYFIEDKGNGEGTISIAWEKLKISFDCR